MKGARWPREGIQEKEEKAGNTYRGRGHHAPLEITGRVAGAVTALHDNDFTADVKFGVAGSITGGCPGRAQDQWRREAALGGRGRVVDAKGRDGATAGQLQLADPLDTERDLEVLRERLHAVELGHLVLDVLDRGVIARPGQRAVAPIGRSDVLESGGMPLEA